MTGLTPEKQLAIISRAWGRSAKGYVFFPWIDREKQRDTGNRRDGYNEGPAFKWPRDKAKILDHLREHSHHDVYWCPMTFEYPQRRADVAGDEHALWADLDEVNPEHLTEYPPTIAWETSPGRYQALWLVATGDLQGASWPGNENQRMTYMIGADPSGWDTTQLLRIPGWPNHKLEYRGPNDSPVRGSLLWDRGRTYQVDDFVDLPEVQGALPASALTEALADEIAAVDRHDVIARVKLKLTKKARELLAAREVMGDRSSNLWYLMRCLADVGCTVSEIVAVVRPTPWNKHEGRTDEIKVLISEATKAIAKRDPDKEETVEEDRSPKPKPGRLFDVLRNTKPPRWLVEGILTEGGCGFIAGEPKSFKSWFGLDLAMSVATGGLFLDHFRVLRPGPVLYIQEEDGPTILKDRAAKVWAGRHVDKMRLHNGELIWAPAEKQELEDPDIMGYIQQGVVISDPGWQEWLDDTLEEGMDGTPYALMIIDTLMMTAGEVDENRAQEMTTKIFKPLKVLARKHNVALIVIHHMKKGDSRGAPQRGGQRLLGSVANHAWAEDSLYLARKFNGDVVMTTESKSAPEQNFKVTGLRDSKVWEPMLVTTAAQEEREPRKRKDQGESAPKQSGKRRIPDAAETLRALPPSAEGHSIRAYADARGLEYQQARRHLMRAAEAGTVEKLANNMWRAK